MKKSFRKSKQKMKKSGKSVTFHKNKQKRKKISEKVIDKKPNLYYNGCTKINKEGANYA